MIKSDQAAAWVRQNGVRLALELAINFGLPILIYDRAKPAYGEVNALIASSLPPILWSVFEFIRARRLDAMSMLAVAGIVLSLLAFAGGGSAEFLQMREKLVTVAIGLIFLGSAAINRPLIYQLARGGLARKSASQLASFEALRERPAFRRTMMIMTLVWGFGLIADAGLSIVLIFTVSVRDYLIAGPILGNGTMGALALWTFWYRRRQLRRGAAHNTAARHLLTGASAPEV